MLHSGPHARVSAPLIKVLGLSAGYNGVSAISDVSLSIYPEDFTAILGPNGAGKSTLLKALIGAAEIYAGDVLFEGVSIRKRRPPIGYVPQLETIDWNFPVTVGETVLMGMTRGSAALPWFGSAEKAAASEIMRRLGIGELAGRQISALSGGQQQRVFLARALVSGPQILLLDEPTAGVDLKTRDDVLHVLDELNHKGIAVVMATHEINAVAAHLPWVIFMNKTVVAEGTPRDVFKPATLALTYGAEMPVTEYAGITMVAETPHFFGRHSHASSDPVEADARQRGRTAILTGVSISSDRQETK